MQDGIPDKINNKLIIFRKESEEQDIAKELSTQLNIFIHKVYKKYYKFPKKMIFTKQDEKGLIILQLAIHVKKNLLYR